MKPAFEFNRSELRTFFWIFELFYYWHGRTSLIRERERERKRKTERETEKEGERERGRGRDLWPITFQCGENTQEKYIYIYIYIYIIYRLC